jgi:hypothetical protein
VAARAAGRTGGGPILRLLGKVDVYTLGLVAAAGPAGGAEAPGFRGHAEVQAAIREARGLLLLGWTGDPEHGSLIVPAKTYEYLAAGRPILALTAPGTEMERVLGGIPGVTLARFEDGPAIGRWLDAVLGSDPPPGPPPSAAAPFTRRAQAGHLAGLLDDAVAAGVAP